MSRDIVADLRDHIDNIAVWTAIWEARSEPDAHARRCAADAIDAADAAIRRLHELRSQLITSTRQADDALMEKEDRT